MSQTEKIKINKNKRERDKEKALISRTLSLKSGQERVGETAQWVKVLAYKPDDLRSIPRTSTGTVVPTYRHNA